MTNSNYFKCLRSNSELLRYELEVWAALDIITEEIKLY